MEYFKLKIFQLNTRDKPSFLYNRASPPDVVNTLVFRRKTVKSPF